MAEGLRGWGYSGEEGVTMAGSSRPKERPYSPSEREAIEQGAAALGLSPDQALACLGEAATLKTLDMFMGWILLGVLLTRGRARGFIPNSPRVR